VLIYRPAFISVTLQGLSCNLYPPLRI
jgi:hypothetical protein